MMPMVYRSLQMVEFVKKSLGPGGGAVIGAARSSAGIGSGCGDSDSEVEGQASKSWWSRLCENKHLTKHDEFYRVRGTTPPPNALNTLNPALSWRRCSPMCQTCATVVRALYARCLFHVLLRFRPSTGAKYQICCTTLPGNVWTVWVCIS